MSQPESCQQPDKTISLAFHSVTNKLTFGSTNYSPRRFHALVRALQHDGILGNILFTFDDGYAHLCDVLPDLVGMSAIRAVVFMPTAYIGRVNSWDYGGALRRMRHLTSDEITQLSTCGIQFGSHGHTHRDLTSLDTVELCAELTESRAILAALTNQPIESISYPFGRTSAVVEKAARDCGYVNGFTMSFPGDRDKAITRGRLPVYCFDSNWSVRAKCSGKGMSYRFLRMVSESAHGLSVGTVLLQKMRQTPKD